jgi:hypothetical protein
MELTNLLSTAVFQSFFAFAAIAAQTKKPTEKGDSASPTRGEVFSPIFYKER